MRTGFRDDLPLPGSAAGLCELEVNVHPLAPGLVHLRRDNVEHAVVIHISGLKCVEVLDIIVDNVLLPLTSLDFRGRLIPGQAAVAFGRSQQYVDPASSFMSAAVTPTCRGQPSAITCFGHSPLQGRPGFPASSRSG